MQKNQTDTPLEALRRVVKEHADTRAEIDRLRKLEPQLQAERDSLISSGRFEDAAAESAISSLDLRLRMLPHKLRQLEDYITSLDKPIYGAASLVSHELLDQVQAIREAVCGEAAVKVKNLGVAMSDLGFDQVVDRVACGAFIAIEITELQALGKAGQQAPRIHFAQATLDLVPRVEALMRLADGKRLAWKPAKVA